MRGSDMHEDKAQADDEVIKKSIQAAQLRMLYAQTPVILLMGFLLASFISAVFSQLVNWLPVIGWWILVNLIMALYLIAYQRFQIKRFGTNHVFWWRLASGYYGILGLCWGIGLVWIIQHSASEYHIFLFTVLVSLAAASIVLSTWMMVYLIFQITLLLPIVGWLLIQNQPAYIVMGIFLIMFMVSMWVFANQVNRMLRKTFRLNLENKALANSLQESNEKLKILNGELTTLSVTDSLTQVANRRYFESQLKKEILRCSRENMPISLIMIDADYFKRYNDILGHLAGDDALMNIAKCISDTVRRPADMVSRYGGEEFSVLLINTTIEGALNVAEQIRYNIEQLKLPHPESPISDYITVSLGVTSAQPSETLSRETLLFKADAALYAAKDGGRNTVCFEEYLDMVIPERKR